MIIDPYQILTELFAQLNAPVDLETLTDTVARLTGIREISIQSPNDSGLDEAATHVLRNEPGSLDQRIDHRKYLRQLWQEICQLPVRQRAVILLNLQRTLFVMPPWVTVGFNPQPEPPASGK